MNKATAGTFSTSEKDAQPREPLWPPLVAMLAVGGLYAGLPLSLQGGAPRWLLVSIVAVLLVLILISHRSGNHSVGRLLGYVVNSIVTVAMIFSLVLLLMDVTEHQISPERLLRS